MPFRYQSGFVIVPVSRSTRRGALPVPVLDHRADLHRQRIERERFGHHRHTGLENTVADSGILRVAGDEEHFETGPVATGRIGELTWERRAIGGQAAIATSEVGSAAWNS
jgi:hypothetical protein